jgi:hypothetical protein
MNLQDRRKLQAQLEPLGWGQHVSIPREQLKHAVGSQSLKVNCWRALEKCLPGGVAPDKVVSIEAGGSIYLFPGARALFLVDRL